MCNWRACRHRSIMTCRASRPAYAVACHAGASMRLDQAPRGTLPAVSGCSARPVLPGLDHDPPRDEASGRSTAVVLRQTGRHVRCLATAWPRWPGTGRGWMGGKAVEAERSGLNERTRRRRDSAAVANWRCTRQRHGEGVMPYSAESNTYTVSDGPDTDRKHGPRKLRRKYKIYYLP